MILAEAAEQGSSIAAQAFFYLAIAVAVGYFGWQFYKSSRENGGAANHGWLSGGRKRGEPSEDTKSVDEAGTPTTDGDDSSK